jgi:elongator complex protein 5
MYDYLRCHVDVDIAYSVILSHHTDVLLPLKFPHYPSAQALLSHISTTVLRVSSFDHHILQLEAESKALPDPIEHDHAKDGILSTLGSNSLQKVIVSLEYRKKSGRTIAERYTLSLHSGKVESLDNKPAQDRDKTGIDFGTTFNLGITQRQKENKEDVVLPHFSAQGMYSEDHLSGKGGSIEYTLEAEDDFDDEEDVDEDLLI